jgi:hypothetical protein
MVWALPKELEGWLAHQLGGFLSSNKNSQANRKKYFHVNHPAQELADKFFYYAA